jgi:protein TonB
VTHPVWLHRPTPADVARFYPPRAIARNREGTASLDCLVGADGRLACTVVAEDPLGWGFGAAALQLARAYQMQPATRDGVPVEARYMLRVPFQLN